jgi:hypothetical protein
VAIQGARVGYDFGDVFSDIAHIGQSKPLVPALDDPVIDVGHHGMVSPSRWDSGNKDLVPAAHVDDGVRQASAVNGAENVEFLLRGSVLAALASQLQVSVAAAWNGRYP